MLPAVRRLFILFHTGLLWTVSKAEASFCTTDQIKQCKNAVKDNSLNNLAAGGICKPGKYVEYTHQCSVTNYIPSSDYCCCAYDQRVLCCRYHYNWNYYRCNEAEDTIQDLTDIPLGLEILIPVIVVPSVALLCFIFYCIKCCCCNDDDDDDGHTCDVFSRCRKRRRRRKKPPVVRQEERYMVPHDNQRSTLLPAPSLKDSSISNSSKTSEKCDSLMDIKYPPLEPPRTQPTAPPYETHAPCNPPPYNPGLYDPFYVAGQSTNGTLPYLRSQDAFGQDVIYQPVMAHAHIPLPVTKLSEDTQTPVPQVEKSPDANTTPNNCEEGDNR